MVQKEAPRHQPPLDRSPWPHPFHGGSAWLPRTPGSILGREEEKGCGTVDRKLVQRTRKGKCLPLGKICLQDLLSKEEHGSSPSPTLNSRAVQLRYHIEPQQPRHPTSMRGLAPWKTVIWR